MEIESGPVPQPTNFDVGFSDADIAEEADIERQILEADKQGTSIGQIEDAKQRGEVKTEEKEAEEGQGSKEEETPDNSETPAEEKQTRGEKGKFTAKSKETSPFEKKRKEEERRQKAWTEFEAECKLRGVDTEALNIGKRTWKDLDRCKDFLRKQVEGAVANERAQLQAERAQVQQQIANRPQYSPHEYQLAAQQFQQAAWKAWEEDDREKATEYFTNANACNAAAQQTWEMQLVAYRDNDISETLKRPEYQELNDPNSAAGQAMMQLIQENPYLAQLPNGFSKGAQYLLAQRDAARVPELEGQLKQKDERIEQLEKELKAATSLAGAGSQAQPAPENFDDMSDREQMRSIERMFSPSGEFVHS